MNSKIKKALFLAGAILIAAALLALGEFENSNLIVSTVMVGVALILLFNTYRKYKSKLKACPTQGPSKSKTVGITLLMVAVFFGLGFSVGKLIYLWSEQI